MVDFRIRVEAGVLAELQNVRKKRDVTTAVGVNFGIDSAIYTKYKDAGSATQVRNLIFRYTASKPSIRYPTQ